MNVKNQICELKQDKKILTAIIKELGEKLSKSEKQNERLISLSKEILVILGYSACDDCDLTCTDCENYILTKSLEKILNKPIKKIMDE